MIDELLRKEVKEKLIRHLDNSYVILSIGDLRELIPELTEIINEKSELPKLNPGPKPPKLIKSTAVPIVKKDEIITLSELEERLIKAALEKTNGSVEETSKETGISERNLYRKFKEYNIDYTKYKK